MKAWVSVAVVAWLLILAVDVGPVHAQALEQTLVGRPAAEASAAETMAVASKLSDRKFELSGLFGTDLTLTVGLDIWANQWQSGTAVGPGDGSGGRNIRNTTFTAFNVGFVPNATLSYQRFFVSASYMITPNYDFGTTRDIGTAQFGQQLIPFVREIRTEASRQEVEVAFGYRFFETERGFIAAAIGYKGIWQDFSAEARFAPINDPENFGPFTKGDSTTRYHGGFLGFVGAASLGSGFGIFGNAAGGALSVSCTPSCPDTTLAPYVAAKVGASYRPFDVPLTFTAGYRVQVINNITHGVSSKTGNVIDLIHGLVVGANWTF